MRCHSLNKKGQLGFEVAWVGIVMLIVALGFLFAYPAFKEINDDIQGDLTLSSIAKNESQAVVGNYASNMDGVFFFLFMMLWGLMVILAFFANRSPVFMMLSVILLIMALVGIMFIGNIYEDAKTDSEVSSLATEFPKMDWLLEHLLIMSVVMAGSIFMVMYTRV